MENEETVQNRFAQRIASTRKSKNLTQAELAKAINQASNGKTKIVQTSIALWETGKRNPSYKSLQLLSKCLDVSIPYLECKTDNPDSNFNFIGNTATNDTFSQKPVSTSDLDYYDGIPLYVVFPNSVANPSEWGIYDLETDTIYFRHRKLSKIKELLASHIVSVFTQQPSYERALLLRKGVPLTLQRLMSQEKVWVEIINTDKHLCGLYNGWYRHNETKTALINNDGLLLPYEGICKTYNAFTLKNNKISDGEPKMELENVIEFEEE